MSKENFINWGDIDVQELLGEFTDSAADWSESEFIITSSSSSSDDLALEPTKITVTKGTQHVHKDTLTQKKSYNYTCPECQKNLQSISGFRGHVLKQHPGVKAKAADHRFEKTDDPKQENQKPVQPLPPIAITDQELEAIFSDSLKMISDDPVYRRCKSKQIDRMLTAVSNLKLHNIASCCPSLTGSVKELVNKHNLVTNKAKEGFIVELHKIKLNKELEEEFTTLSGDTISMVFPVFLNKLVTVLFKVIKIKVDEHCADLMPTTDFPLSKSDEEVLYHVAGFVAKKTHIFVNKLVNYKAFGNHDKDKFLALSGTFATDKPPENFVKAYTQWTTEQDRGGLRYATADFYLFVREFDNVHRSQVNIKNIQARSLEKNLLLEKIFDSEMVSFYWAKMTGIAHIEEDLKPTLKIFEFAANLFLTIKGFAIAKKLSIHAETSTTATCQKATKSSFSLRKSLK